MIERGFRMIFMDEHRKNYYTVCPVFVDGEQRLWIQHDDGEGGSFDPALVYNLIHEYFRNNF